VLPALQVPLPIAPVCTVNDLEKVPSAAVVVVAKRAMSQPACPLRFAHWAMNSPRLPG
jgi:hypothetical protein